MSNPHRYRKTGPRAYAVTVVETGTAVGTVDRVSPDHVKLNPKWRATATDGTDLGSHHYSRDSAAHALADRGTPARPPLVTVATPNDVADLAVVQAFGQETGWGALNPGHSYPGRDSYAGGWDPLSMEGPHRSTWHLTGYRLVGQTDTRAVYVWRFAIGASTRYCAAVVDIARDPARIVVTHVYDYQPEAETTRHGAEEKAADVLAELQAKDSTKLAADLVAELQADARTACAAGDSAAPALSAVVQRELAGLPVGSARGMAVMTTWADAYEAQRLRELAAALPELAAADCDCTETCERCGETFDLDQAGTTDHHSGISLCTDCTAHNADRVTL